MKKLIMVITCLIFAMYSFSGSKQKLRMSTSEKLKSNQIDECTEYEMFYTVQIGVFTRLRAPSDFPDEIQSIQYIERPDGLYAYFCGMYDCRFEAMEKRFTLTNLGLYDSYVTVLYNGEQISFSEADELLEKNGASILFNSDEENLVIEDGE